MSKNITVQFDDGSSHIYEDVPDEVSEQDVKNRALQDFGKNVVSAQTPEQIQQKQNEVQKANEPSLGEKVVGAAMIPLQTIAEHPVAAGAALGAYKALSLGNKYLEGKGIDRAIAQQQAATAADAQALARERMAERMARPGMSAPVQPNPGLVDAAGNPLTRTVPTTGPVAPPSTPAAMPTAQPVQQPSMLQRGMQYADKVRQLAMEKVMQNAGAISNVAKAGVGLGAALYSPSLNANEEEELRKRRMMGYQGQ